MAIDSQQSLQISDDGQIDLLLYLQQYYIIFIIKHQSNITFMNYSLNRNKVFQYNSIVMGSKVIPNILPFKKNNFTSNKSIMKKHQSFNNKFGKNKINRFKTRNERPDIYLQGQQVVNFKPTWNQDIDLRFIEAFRQKIKKSSLNQVKMEVVKKKSICSKQDTTNCMSSDDSSIYIKTFSATRAPSSSVFKKPAARMIAFSQKTQRQQTDCRNYNKQRHKQLKIGIQQRLQAKKQQAQKQKVVGDQGKKKQLFYLNQRDLNGIKSQSFIIVQYPNNQIITGYYYKRIVEIASLTKIMTFYASMRLIIQNCIDPHTHLLQIDSNAADMTGTSAELYEGDVFSITQLFYALMLPSGNDAALALSRWGNKLLKDGQKGFINYMNRLAGQIGMKNSCFGNPHGLPHPHNSCTAEDVSILIIKCLQFHIFRDIIKCQKYKCWTQNNHVKRQVTWQNTNKLLRRPGFQGIKTGVTATAGPCLATLYNANDRYFIIVLLRTNKLSRRFKQTRWILGLCLKKLNGGGQFNSKIASLLRQDSELDSDNSEQQQQFNFQRSDLKQFEKRKRILRNEL